MSNVNNFFIVNLKLKPAIPKTYLSQAMPQTFVTATDKALVIVIECQSKIPKIYLSWAILLSQLISIQFGIFSACLISVFLIRAGQSQNETCQNSEDLIRPELVFGHALPVFLVGLQLHIKLGSIKQFVRALSKDGDASNYLCLRFSNFFGQETLQFSDPSQDLISENLSNTTILSIVSIRSANKDIFSRE